MTVSLPKLLPRAEILERLAHIFPEGFEFRSYVVRDVAASTIYTMLYVGAMEGSQPETALAPKHVYRMTSDQAAKTSDAARIEYATECIKSGFQSKGRQWYADTSKEQIRDEVIRYGLVAAGAASVDPAVPTTSSAGRYALKMDFGALFNPDLNGDKLTAGIKAWQKTHLSKGALAKIKLDESLGDSAVKVEFPGIGSRQLTPGPSSVISKAVVEEFATRFLVKPRVLWLSESGNKVVAQDEILARKIGINIDPAKNLPDIILADLGLPEILLVFVEVVASDGPVSEVRREQLMALVREAGLTEKNAAFVTAFMDRSHPALKRTLPMLAWKAFIWIAAEPDRIVGMIAQREDQYGSAKSTPKLHELLGAIGEVDE